MDITFYLFSALILILVFYLFRLNSNPKCLPPGPPRLPLFGNVLSMVWANPAEKMLSFSKKYGPAFTIYFGSKPCVVLCDYTDMKAMMKRKETVGRPKHGIFYKLGGGKGLILSSGKFWHSSRKMILHHLRDSSANYMETVVSTELKNVVRILKEHADQDKPIDLAHCIHQSSCNIIMFICFGKFFDYDDPLFVENVDRLKRNFELFLKVQSLSVLKPWISPILRIYEKEILENSNRFRQPLIGIADELKRSDTKDPESNLVHRFFVESEKEREELTENKVYTDEHLTEIMVDLFSAGTETLASTIRWLILYMLEYPEIRAKMQNEWKEVVGSRIPTIEDRSKLPYTNACLQETERMASIGQLSVIHTSVCDFEWNGYTIPKDTDIMYNIWAVHNDPEIWKNPEEFNPDRFINESGQVFRPDPLIPFGTGRRACPGESLAKIELFLYTTTLYHYFDFHRIKGESDMHSPIRSGLTREPQKYKIRVTLRNLEA